ncbi:MAG TPA: hypothetical protein VGQ07_02710, partial [Nitrospirales bacterium]|nr:hypothetical protein [Nitrospirales bacterium]
MEKEKYESKLTSFLPLERHITLNLGRTIRRLSLFSLIICPIIAFVLVSCGSSPPIKFLKDIPGLVVDDPPIYWIDNELLIFLGFRSKDIPEIAQGKGKYGLPREIYIVKVTNGHMQKYAEVAEGPFCYNRGYVVYKKRGGDSGKPTYWAGKLGKEEEHPEIEKKGMQSYLT